MGPYVGVIPGRPHEKGNYGNRLSCFFTWALEIQRKSHSAAMMSISVCYSVSSSTLIPLWMKRDIPSISMKFCSHRSIWFPRPSTISEAVPPGLCHRKWVWSEGRGAGRTILGFLPGQRPWVKCCYAIHLFIFTTAQGKGDHVTCQSSLS